VQVEEEEEDDSGSDWENASPSPAKQPDDDGEIGIIEEGQEDSCEISKVCSSGVGVTIYTMLTARFMIRRSSRSSRRVRCVSRQK
jgi:hypothetical protein